MKTYVALGDSISIDDYAERETGIPDIGAASLFARELRRRHPELRFDNLTAGGNDMLMHLGAPRPPVRLVEGSLERLARIVMEITRRLPNAVILLGTVYDPSDGTNTLDRHPPALPRPRRHGAGERPLVLVRPHLRAERGSAKWPRCGRPRCTVPDSVSASAHPSSAFRTFSPLIESLLPS